MRFAILDAHGNVILEWDVNTVAERAFPRRFLHARKRRLIVRELSRALEELKLDLFAL